MLVTKYQFTRTNVANYVPELPGVYQLYGALGDLLYTGKAEKSVRQRLWAHVTGNGDPIARKVFSFSWEQSLDPAARERALLMAFQLAHGRLPEGNHVMPSDKQLTLSQILAGIKK